MLTQHAFTAHCSAESQAGENSTVDSVWRLDNEQVHNSEVQQKSTAKLAARSSLETPSTQQRSTPPRTRDNQIPRHTPRLRVGIPQVCVSHELYLPPIVLVGYRQSSGKIIIMSVIMVKRLA